MHIRIHTYVVQYMSIDGEQIVHVHSAHMYIRTYIVESVAFNCRKFHLVRRTVSAASKTAPIRPTKAMITKFHAINFLLLLHTYIRTCVHVHLLKVSLP